MFVKKHKRKFLITAAIVVVAIVGTAAYCKGYEDGYDDGAEDLGEVLLPIIFGDSKESS